jgi:hypothetical protein
MSIKTTSEHCRDCGAAVCVKDYERGYMDGGADEQRERAYQSAQETWWRNADAIAARHGYSGASACGRSGGWCAPYTGDPGSGRRVIFEDDANAPAFVAFAADIEAAMKGAAKLFADELARTIADDAESEASNARATARAKAMAAIVPRLADALRASVKSLELAVQWSQAPNRCAMREDLNTARETLAEYDELTKDTNA